MPLTQSTFGSIKSYNDMVGRIAWSTGIVAAFVIGFIQSQVPGVDHIVEGLPSQWESAVPLEGIAISLVAVFGGTVVGLISAALKLHDRISDMFRIRERYDIQEILVPLALGSGVTIGVDRWLGVPARRRQLMKTVFYPYATSRSEGGVVDSHLISMVYDHWFWYWALLEATLIIFLAAVVFAVFQQFFWTAVFLAVVLAAVLVLQRVLRSEFATPTHDQVRDILRNAQRREDIRAVFDEVLR